MRATEIILKHLISTLENIRRKIEQEMERYKTFQTQKREGDRINSLRQEKQRESKIGETRFPSVEQVSTLLGLKKPTVYRLFCNKRIPYYKLGSRVLFNERKIIEWMEKKTVDPFF